MRVCVCARVCVCDRKFKSVRQRWRNTRKRCKRGEEEEKEKEEEEGRGGKNNRREKGARVRAKRKGGWEAGKG